MYVIRYCDNAYWQFCYLTDGLVLIPRDRSAQLDRRQPQKFLYRDARFHAREAGAEAGMTAGAESNVRLLFPFQIELRWAAELMRVAIGSAEQEHHAVALLYLPVAKDEIARRDACNALHWAFEPHDFRNDAGRRARRLPRFGVKLRMAQKPIDAGRDQRGRRFRANGKDEKSKGGRLDKFPVVRFGRAGKKRQPVVAFFIHGLLNSR
jgi:hypothetical protein